MPSIVNRRNAAFGWVAWRVVKRMLRRKASPAERAKRIAPVVLLVVGAVAAAAVGFLRRSQ